MTQYDVDQTAQSVAEDVAGDSGMSGTEASLEISDFLGRCTYIYIIEGSLEVKLPTIWTDEKQSRAEAERRGRLEERSSEEKE
jgi:hypothetical protein